jgi:hypothetical protein
MTSFSDCLAYIICHNASPRGIYGSPNGLRRLRPSIFYLHVYVMYTRLLSSLLFLRGGLREDQIIEIVLVNNDGLREISTGCCCPLLESCLVAKGRGCNTHTL